MSEVILPELGEGIEKAVIACWHVKVGDQVKTGDDVVELVTDKASFYVEAPSEGLVKEIKYAQGDEVSIGEVLAVIST
jgi:2-oxoglutarate dehydrogenase E2 component (dihydrolipoamide succinyltransferase)